MVSSVFVMSSFADVAAFKSRSATGPILPVQLEIVFVLLSQDPHIPFFQSFDSKLAIHRRYTERRFLRTSLLLFIGHYGATGAL